MYERQLAHVHDLWFQDHALAAAKMITHLIPQAKGPIIDIGCGSGIFLKQFEEMIPEGYGFDLSPEMIRLAREKVPQYQLKVSDLFETRFSKAEIIASMGEILSYASVDRLDLEKDIRNFFHYAHEQLVAGGLFFFDCLVDTYDFNYTKVFDQEGVTIMVKSSSEGGIVTREIITFLPKGDLFEKSSETHRQRIFEAQWLKRLLMDSGFEVQLIEAYGDYELPPGRLGFLCS